MVFAELNLCFRELLARRRLEVRHSLLHILLPVHESIPPDNAQSVVTLLLAILSSPLEPQLRHHGILLHTLASQIHPTEVPSSESRVPSTLRTLFLRLRLLGASGVLGPDLASNTEEVVSRGVIVALHPACTIATRGNTANRAVYASLVEDLAQAVSKIDFAAVCVELPGGWLATVRCWQCDNLLSSTPEDRPKFHQRRERWQS